MDGTGRAVALKGTKCVVCRRHILTFMDFHGYPADLARIGHYYATESMLVLDPATGDYSAALTPETGNDTLFDHYRAVLSGEAAPDDRGEHAVF